MPTSASDSAIRDNHKRGTVADFLRGKLRPGSHVSVVSAYFTIYAYEALKTHLDAIEHLNFLFGEPAFLNRLDPERSAKKSFLLEEAGLSLANQLQQKRVARECAHWIERKVDIKTIRQSNLLHGKMYHIANAGVEEAILGSSNFTVSGLGLASSGNNIELNLVVDSNRDRQELKQWFDEIWNDDGLTRDVKQEVLLYLRKLHANQSPQFIYYLTLFHLFRDFLDGSRDLDDNLRRMALPDTRIWQTLFTFQKDGAKAAINKILRYNGCILADSVGLGKTYTALAVIKYFELRNERVLVLCPKKLSRNWTIYKNPSTLNPFSDDKFRYDVLHHTDLSRDSGEVNGLHLDSLNWGAYDLVVIDESHNFRNNKLATQRPGEPEKRSRYQRLMDDIISAGVKTKVLLLSATPVNNQLADLRNQISFIAGGDVARNDHADAAFAETLNIPSVRDTSRQAQTHFTNWAKKPPGQRKTRDLIAAIGGDFFKLLDGLSIARSRRQIASYYAQEMKTLGGFPRRPPPKAIHAPIDLEQRFLSFEQLDDEISALRLALYHPTSFLRDDLPPEICDAYQSKMLGGFTQEGRERILIAMMKVNFLKRLESSVDSFRLTLQRTIEKIDRLEERITAFEQHLNDNPDLDYDALTPDQFEDPDFDQEDFTIGGRRRIHLGHLKLPEWLKAVRTDRTQLQFLLEKTQSVTAARDGKLAELKKLIAEKVLNPTTNRDGKPNRKVLVFTAFADTARYLHENLAPWVQEWQGQLAPDPKCQGLPAPATSETGAGRPCHSLFLPYDPEAETRRSRQNLPHWSQTARTYFVTYRLADSIAQSTIRQWQEEIEHWKKHHPEPWNPQTLAEYDRFFQRKEAWLDAGHGSCVLAQPEIRSLVEENLRHFDGQRYILDEFVIMPNHVHAIVKPLEGHALSDILHSWKSYTAKLILKKTGGMGPVWMSESFDHIVRSWEQLEHFRRYIRENPAKSGLGAHLQSGRGCQPLKVGGAARPLPSVGGAARPSTSDQQGQAAPATPLHIALVVGDGGNKTTLGSADYDDILTNFAPLAKRRADQPGRFPNQREEIDLLIATDCISEGQNLQDCDLLINYDIHWNPVRIIQRFGRIDRIGSRNDAVQLVNFWPVADLDHYLGVKQRVEARMALVDLAATQTDNLLDPGQLEDLIKEDLLFRDRQLKRLKDEILDLEDLDDSVSLTDFSLDEFRLDLLRYLEANREVLENSPEGVYAVVPPKADLFVKAQPGALFLLRHKGSTDNPVCAPPTSRQPGMSAPQSLNPLAPYYLVYVHDDGTVRFSFAQPKESMLLFRDLAAGETAAFETLCDLFDQRTRDGADMTHYHGLIRKALASIEHTFQRRATSALLSGRSAVLPTAAEAPTSKPDDFDLVTWLVILQHD